MGRVFFIAVIACAVTDAVLRIRKRVLFVGINRDCQYCSERFSVKNNNRLFCSDKCKVRYNRENRLTRIKEYILAYE